MHKKLEEIYICFGVLYFTYDGFSEIISDLLEGGVSAVIAACDMLKQPFSVEDKIAREIIHIVVRDISHYSDLVLCAEMLLRKDTLDDKKISTSIYNLAISSAKYSVEYQEIAESISEVRNLNNKKWAKEIYQKSLKEVEHYFDYKWIAESIADRKYLGNAEWARRVYNEALCLAKDDENEDECEEIIEMLQLLNDW